MTLSEFFGCAFIAYGPPLAMFIFTVASDPVKIIVLVAGAFFWLLSLLVSSILWIAVVPLKEDLAFGLTFSVLFQELFRYLYYRLLRKAEAGMQAFNERDFTVQNRHKMAYVSGFGFGLMSGAFSFINILAEMSGPGTVGIYGHSGLFSIISALMTLCIILLNTFWGVVFFDGLDKRSPVAVVYVVGSHMLISCLTLLNQQNLYAATLIPAYVVMVITLLWAYKVAGGSLYNIKMFLTCRHGGYTL